jgi:uncharacterized SAM-binding protein YcdF (DUF218 family)
MHTSTGTLRSVALGTLVLSAAGSGAPSREELGASILLPPLEHRFAYRELPSSSVTGIIALGGDFTRAVEAVELAHALPGAKLVISGRGEERAHAYALSHGITADRLVIEGTSANTFENAQFTNQVLHPSSDERWILVTSASHMPRAVGSFRNAGFLVLPWPVAHISEGHSWNTAVHEWLGLLAYRVLGRTNALFPGA